MHLHLSRLYVKGVVMGFKRGLRNQYEHTSLIKIDHVKEKKDTAFYLGKRICFIYKVSWAKYSHFPPLTLQMKRSRLLGQRHAGQSVLFGVEI